MHLQTRHIRSPTSRSINTLDCHQNTARQDSPSFQHSNDSHNMTKNFNKTCSKTPPAVEETLVPRPLNIRKTQKPSDGVRLEDTNGGKEDLSRTVATSENTAEVHANDNGEKPHRHTVQAIRTKFGSQTLPVPLNENPLNEQTRENNDTTDVGTSDAKDQPRKMGGLAEYSSRLEGFD